MLLLWMRDLSVPRCSNERGDVPGYVLIFLMSSALVVAIWGIAHERLVSIVTNALSNVCGSVGC